MNNKIFHVNLIKKIIIPKAHSWLCFSGWCLFIFLFLTNAQAAHYYSTFSRPTAEPDLVIGHHNPSDATILHKFFRDNKELFEVTYHTDHLGHRISPGKYEGRNKFALFMGCSFTFGVGVQDNETVPYYFAEKQKDYVPYNYGLGASGPHQFLRLLETKNLREEIKEEQGIGIFYYIEEHIQRATMHLPSIGWLRQSPHYELNQNQELEYQGNFEEDKSLWAQLLLKLAFQNFDYFTHHIFPRVSKQDGDTTCKIIKKIKSEFLKQFPNSQFVVLYNSGDMIYPMKNCLKKEGINYVSVAPRVNIQLGKKASIYGDGHPTALANELIANILAEELP